MKKSNTEKKGGERQGKEHHTYKKKKKLYRKTRKEKCEKRNSLCDSTNFLNASRLSPVNFFPTICTTRIPYSYAPVANRKVEAMRKVTGAAYQTKISWFEGFR